MRRGLAFPPDVEPLQRSAPARVTPFSRRYLITPLAGRKETRSLWRPSLVLHVHCQVMFTDVETPDDIFLPFSVSPVATRLWRRRSKQRSPGV